MRGFRVFTFLPLLLLPFLGHPVQSPAAPVRQAAKQKPLFRDFMGLNVHTVQFKPDVYKPICRLLRDYHPFDWDIGKDTSHPTEFPLAQNRVDWKQLYGDWTKAAYAVNACAIFDNFPAKDWKDIPKDAFAYGKAFASYFGPANTRYAESIEIGNEPGLYDDATYRSIFENMARGARAGDPKLKVATCALTAEKSHRYAKSVTCVKGLESLYDVINMHTYAELEPYPTWRRSYPEDKKLKYLTDVQAIVDWRNANAPGKEIWITEFGYDASTKPAPATGDFSKWVGSTEAEQARYLVRSFLVFSAMDVDRAYIFWFNDSDQPQIHGSSGLTRDYKPKPSFHAVAHLYKTLGDYRFTKTVEKRADDVYVYEFAKVSDPKERIWAIWSPDATDQAKQVELPAPSGKIQRIERMPMKEGAADTVAAFMNSAGKLGVPVGGAPIYVWFRQP